MPARKVTIYVSKDNAATVDKLEAIAKATGTALSDLVLAAAAIGVSDSVFKVQVQELIGAHQADVQRALAAVRLGPEGARG